MSSPRVRKFFRGKFGGVVDYYRRRLPPEKRAFCEQWLLERDEQLAWITVVLAGAFHGLSLFLDPFIADQPRTVEVLRYTHVLTLIVVLSWNYFLREKGRLAVTVNFVAQACSIGGYLYICREYVEASPLSVTLPLLRMWTTVVIIAVFQILLSPTVLIGPLSSALALILASAWVWWPSPMVQKNLPIAIWAFSAAAIYQLAQSAKAVNEALREHEARERIGRAERASLERDLELAREIQDSLAPPRLISRDNVVAYCFQKKHSQVGGDWAAMRLGDQGEFYAVVADAAGKGVQAALVIHAEQSLWAETLGRCNFEPKAWIDRVNHALCQLGEKQPHMVTMGVVKIHQGICTYWSAGHLPLFIVMRSPGEAEVVRVIMGRGNPLGLREDMHVEPASTSLAGKSNISVLLGSDGVFEKGTLYRSKDIIGIRDGLKLRGNAILDECTAEDDKTLIWIDKPAA